MAREPESIDQQRRVLGELLATFRKAAGLTQGQLAKAAFRDRSTVAHIENGRARADERFWQACDDTVKANGVLVTAFHDLEAAKQAHQQHEQRTRLAQARARANSLSTSLTGTVSSTLAESEAPNSAYALSMAPRRPSVRAGRSLDQSTHHAAAMASFRDVDRQVGGGHVYPAVAAYLSSAVSRDLLDVATSTTTFTAAAALSEMAGWMAHDAGDNTVTGQHFGRAVNLAAVGAEPEVMVHLLASSAHLALHQGDPRRAAIPTFDGPDWQFDGRKGSDAGMVVEWTPEMRVARIAGPSVRTLAFVMVCSAAGSILFLIILALGLATSGSGYSGSRLLTVAVIIGALCGAIAITSELLLHYSVRKRELRAGYTTSASGPVRVPQVDPRSNRVIRSGGEAHLDPDEYRRRLALARRSALRERPKSEQHGGTRPSDRGTGDDWTMVIKDGLGRPLVDGGAVVLLTAVKFGKSSTVLEAGTRLNGIRLAYDRDDDKVVSANVLGVGKLNLRAGSVKKV